MSQLREGQLGGDGGCCRHLMRTASAEQVATNLKRGFRDGREVPQHQLGGLRLPRPGLPGHQDALWLVVRGRRGDPDPEVNPGPTGMGEHPMLVVSYGRVPCVRMSANKIPCVKESDSRSNRMKGWVWTPLQDCARPDLAEHHPVGLMGDGPRRQRTQAEHKLDQRNKKTPAQNGRAKNKHKHLALILFPFGNPESKIDPQGELLE